MRPTAAERLEARLLYQPNGCLEWTGGTNEDGYGVISVEGKNVKTHRFAWELAHGPIPPGMKVLHHCDNPPCCEAIEEHHLFLGTQAENNADRATKGRNGDNGEKARTHCPANHLYDEANTRVSKNGKRQCRACDRASWHRRAEVNNEKRRQRYGSERAIQLATNKMEAQTA